MTKEEAKQQLEAFFRKLGIKASFFDDKNFAKANIGEAVLGFEFLEEKQILQTKALIFRFRRPPEPKILSAIYAEANEQNSGGGEIYLDEEDLSLYLEKDFDEKLDDDIFYEQVNNLAQASLLWSGSILQQVAEKVHGN